MEVAAAASVHAAAGALGLAGGGREGVEALEAPLSDDVHGRPAGGEDPLLRRAHGASDPGVADHAPVAVRVVLRRVALEHDAPPAAAVAVDEAVAVGVARAGE